MKNDGKQISLQKRKNQENGVQISIFITTQDLGTLTYVKFGIYYQIFNFIIN